MKRLAATIEEHWKGIIAFFNCGYLKTTYRGLIDLLQRHQGLREVLGMERKLPHYTTLQKFGSRSQVMEIADAVIRRIGVAALKAGGQEEQVVAMDATGLEMGTASAHFVSRSGRGRKHWVKISVMIVCGSLFPLDSVFSIGPDNGKCQAEELMEKSLNIPL